MLQLANTRNGTTQTKKEATSLEWNRVQQGFSAHKDKS